MDTQQNIKNKIQSLISDAEIQISGSDCSFSITIISNQFEGQSLLNRQKKIMKLFESEIQSGQMHALSLKTYTKTEFEK